jgi:hypothetical protein
VTSEVHTPDPGDEHPGAAGALAGSLLNKGRPGLEAASPRPLDLKAARERCRQASEGPWEPSPNAGDAVIAPKADRLLGIDTEYYGGPIVGESMHPADREFVIHARTDLPAALDELEAAREVVEFARHTLRPWFGENYGLGPPLDEKLAAYDEATKEKPDGD